MIIVPVLWVEAYTWRLVLAELYKERNLGSSLHITMGRSDFIVKGKIYRAVAMSGFAGGRRTNPFYGVGQQGSILSLMTSFATQAIRSGFYPLVGGFWAGNSRSSVSAHAETMIINYAVGRGLGTDTKGVLPIGQSHPGGPCMGCQGNIRKEGVPGGKNLFTVVVHEPGPGLLGYWVKR